MKRITIVCSIAGLLFMAACTPPSIEPFYSEKTLVRDPSLPGLWRNSNTRELIEFSATPQGTYECKYSLESFRAVLFELGGERYLDVYPLDRGPERNALHEMTYIPAHILFRVVREDNHLRMALLDPEWLDDYLGEDSTLQYSVTSRGVLLTGPTEQIQAFLMSHGDDPAAFAHWSEWRRLPSLPSNSGSLSPTK